MSNPFTTIEIVGFLISLLIALIPLFHSVRSGDRETAKYQRTLAFILSALGVILTVILSIRYEYINELALIKDEDTLKTVAALKTSTNKVNSANVHLFQEVFTEREQAFNKTLKDVSSGQLVLTPEELGRHAVKLFQNEQNTTILATSYVKPTEWWKTTWGKEYLQENFAAVKRNVNIERIYIFANEKELSDNKELLDTQKENKISIRYIYEKDVLNISIKDDVIIIGDKLCGTLSLKEGRTMIEAIFSINPDDIAKNKRKFEELRKISTQY